MKYNGTRAMFVMIPISLCVSQAALHLLHGWYTWTVLGVYILAAVLFFALCTK